MTFEEFLRDVFDNQPGTITFSEWMKMLEPRQWLEYGDKFAELERDFISDDLELVND